LLGVMYDEVVVNGCEPALCDESIGGGADLLHVACVIWVHAMQLFRWQLDLISFVVDALGNARGGLRSTYIDVPC
jgi:hypothetical protein